MPWIKTCPDGKYVKKQRFGEGVVFLKIVLMLFIDFNLFVAAQNYMYGEGGIGTRVYLRMSNI